MRGAKQALIVAVAGTAVAAAAAPGDGAAGSPQADEIDLRSHAARRTCKRLKGRDLAPARKVKLVRRANQDNGTDLLGCVLPRGRVRKLTSSSAYETSEEGYRVRRVRGAIVLLSEFSASQYASDFLVSVYNIKTGRAYLVARSCFLTGSGPCTPTPNASAAAALINSLGQAAAAIVPEGGATTTIAGFSSSGQRQDLDSGPSSELPGSSLRLSGRIVSWTHAGQPRSALLGDSSATRAPVRFFDSS